MENEATQEMNVFVKTLVKQLSLVVRPNNTVAELKEMLESKEGVPPEMMKLVFDGRVLQDDRTLSDYAIQRNSTIKLVLCIGGPPKEEDRGYEARLSFTEPARHSEGVSMRPRIKVKFVGGRKSFNLSFFSDLSLIKCSYPPNKGTFHSFQNDWHRSIGVEESQTAFWTDETYRERFMLLELREEFSRLSSGVQIVRQLDLVRYHCFKINKTYYGGDIRSWQRYTHKRPLQGTITIRQDEQEVHFEPNEALQPNTWYVMALLHTSHAYDPYFFEDLLIPFKTGEN